MLSEKELDNFYRLLRSVDNDSISLALKMVKTAGLKIKDLEPLYQELIHLCNAKDHPDFQRFNSLLKKKARIERILYINKSNTISVKEPERVRFLEFRQFFNDIRKIQCWSVDLRAFPDNLLLYQQIEELNLGNNFLKILPDALGTFSKLKKLNLIANQFSDFPEVLTKLNKLEELHLGANLLTEIPNAISNMNSLKVLSLTNNKIEKLPIALLTMKNLQILSLEQNPLQKSDLDALKNALPNCKIY
jgi:Leucine-rich repeat (LRR) protein